MYKNDLALNKPQRLICHKTTKPDKSNGVYYFNNTPKTKLSTHPSNELYRIEMLKFSKEF